MYIIGDIFIFTHNCLVHEMSVLLLPLLIMSSWPNVDVCACKCKWVCTSKLQKELRLWFIHRTVTPHSVWVFDIYLQQKRNGLTISHKRQNINRIFHGVRNINCVWFSLQVFDLMLVHAKSINNVWIKSIWDVRTVIESVKKPTTLKYSQQMAD